jgi:uncharacterized membrane protein YgcG
MDKHTIITLLKGIPAEFRHNDYATRAIYVAIKRIGELYDANILADSDNGLLPNGEVPRQQAPEQASFRGLADSANPSGA